MKNMKYPALYKRNSNRSIQVWWIETEGAKYRTSTGKLDGKIVTTEWRECEPKNLGKANETSGEIQATMEAEACIVKQLKSNYFKSIEDIDTGFLPPQLAKPCKEYIEDVDWAAGQIVDQKLNGIACVITRHGAFSRKNEIFYAIPHILEDLEAFFERFPNAYLHGELYNEKHVNELNKIAELVAVTRKEKDITPELLEKSRAITEYHLYDGYGFLGLTAEENGYNRRMALTALFSAENFKFVKPVKYTTCFSFEQMKKYADDYIASGGEGVIIRDPKAPYHHKRTKSLLKFKKFESEEFKVISVEEGSANWKGCAKFVWCENPKGIREQKFKSNISGTQSDLRKAFENCDSYIGKMITVDFQEYSPYLTPLIPYTNLLVRDYE